MNGEGMGPRLEEREDRLKHSLWERRVEEKSPGPPEQRWTRSTRGGTPHSSFTSFPLSCPFVM